MSVTQLCQVGLKVYQQMFRNTGAPCLREAVYSGSATNFAGVALIESGVLPEAVCMSVACFALECLVRKAWSWDRGWE